MPDIMELGNGLLPTQPSEGPPLPRALGQKWPTSLQDVISGAVVRSVKIMNRSIKEKKGAPLPIMLFGPMGSYIVKLPEDEKK